MKIAAPLNPRPGLPKRTFIERVMLPRRLYDEPESGLDAFIGAATPMIFAAAGLHMVGDMFHALETTSEIHDSMKPETMTQAEIQARRAFSQSVGQPTLSTPNPVVMVPSERTVVRTVDPLDPEMVTLDPALAARYRPIPRAATLSAAVAARSDATPSVLPGKDAKLDPKLAEALPWRRRN